MTAPNPASAPHGSAPHGSAPHGSTEHAGHLVPPARALMARAVLAVLVLGAALGAWMVFLHAETGCHACVLPASAPQRLHVDGRNYARGRVTDLPGNVRRLGLTLGGGQMYDRPVPGMTAMDVWVRDRQGTVHEYGLLGGP